MTYTAGDIGNDWSFTATCAGKGFGIFNTQLDPGTTFGLPGSPTVSVVTGLKNIPVPIPVTGIATEIDPFFDDLGAGFALPIHQCPSGPHITTVTVTAIELPLGGLATLDFQFEITLDP